MAKTPYHLIFKKPSLLLSENRNIFLLSHMRSRSSVLSHILGTNKEIEGYSELHISYRNNRDLLKQKLHLYQDLRCDFKGKFLYDKILHNNLTINSDFFHKNSIKVIFMIRKPSSTLKSILKMGEITGKDWYKDPEKALSYYKLRLLELEKLSYSFRGNYNFIESDDLVKKPDHVLPNLSEWLGLNTPLSQEYKTFENTGKPGYGDPSNEIRSGVLTETSGHNNVAIDGELLKQGENTYYQCKKTLLQNLS